MQKQDVNSVQANNSTLTVRAIPHSILMKFLEAAVSAADDRSPQMVTYDNEYEDADGVHYILSARLEVNEPYGKGPKWVDVFECYIDIYDAENDYACSINEGTLAQYIEEYGNRGFASAYDYAHTLRTLSCC